jgi:nucleotide-binding universal stress UspA family protein
MNRLKRILFPTDFSDFSEQALSHLVDLLDPETELHIVEGVRSLTAEGQAQFAAKVTDLKAKLAVLRPVDAKPLSVKARQLSGVAPAPVTVAYATEAHIDLIVLATHGGRGIKSIFLGSVAEEINRLAQGNVLTVAVEKARPYREVMVPLDFSRNSLKSLMCAAELARENGARLHLLHVISEQLTSTLRVTGRKSLLDYEPDLDEKTRAHLEKMARKSNCGEVVVHVKHGRIYREIETVVREHDIDLVIMASSDRDDPYLGSTTQMVLHYAGSSVLVLRHLH